MIVAGDAGRRSGGQGAGRRALLLDLLCKVLYNNIFLYHIIFCVTNPAMQGIIYFFINYYKFCYARHFGHMGRASSDGRMMMATNGKVINVGSRGAVFFRVVQVHNCSVFLCYTKEGYAFIDSVLRVFQPGLPSLWRGCLPS